VGSQERGVYAKRDIEAGPFALIPRHICFRTDMASYHPPLFQFLLESKASFPLTRETADRAALAAFLLYEKHVRGEDSFWFPFIASLPTSSARYPSFLYASIEELERYKISSFLLDNVKGGFQVLDSWVELIRKRPDLFPLSPEILPSEFRWAYYMVTSRAWSRDPLEMIPFGDMMNHKVDATVVLNSNDTFNNFVHIGNEPLREGEEVFDNYQRTPTPFLYANSWGFIPEASECFANIDHKVKSHAHIHLLARLQCFSQHGLLSLTHRCSRKHLSKKFFTCWAAFNLDHAAASNASDWIPVKRTLGSDLSTIADMVEPTSSLARRDLFRQLYSEAESKRNSVPFDREEEELLKDPHLDMVHRLAIETRLATIKCFENLMWVAKQHEMDPDREFDEFP